MKKTYRYLILALAGTTILSGCGKKDDDKHADETEASVSTETADATDTETETETPTETETESETETETEEPTGEEPSYPYIVLRTELLEEPVVFQ